MINLFSKRRFAALLALACVTSSSLMAWEECDTSRFYIGGFGGGLYSDSTRVSQWGTAFFDEDNGGPLAVVAEGHTKKKTVGFGGVQVGYEVSKQLGCSNWTLAPAGELEAFFFSHKKKGDLFNDTDPDRLPEHDFVNSFKLETSVILVNAVLTLNNACWPKLSPYIGGGIGAAHVSLKNAKSIQVDPPEECINHYNSGTKDATWAFAGQFKAGLKYNLCRFHIFAEYRYVFLDETKYVLGSTVYPGEHVPTSPWNTKVHDISYNAWVVGIQYDL